MSPRMGARLQGKRALVTGASSGIGEAIARALAAQGADLILVARREDRLVALAEQLQAAHGVEVWPLVSDLARRGGAEAVVRAVHESGLPVDFLVNNAGVGLAGRDLDLPNEDVERMLDLNVRALVLLTRAFATDMAARGYGRILQVASTAAAQPTPGYAAYAASKAFVVHYSEALNHELSGSGVRVTTLCPGVTETGFFEVAHARLGRYQRATLMQPEAVAAAGLTAMMRGQGSVTPGAINRVGSVITGLLPRALAAALVAALLKR